jgi:YD repeat-containing protein
MTRAAASANRPERQNHVLRLTDAAQNVTTYAYDLGNSLLRITDAAQHTTLLCMTR